MTPVKIAEPGRDDILPTHLKFHCLIILKSNAWEILKQNEPILR